MSVDSESDSDGETEDYYDRCVGFDETVLSSSSLQPRNKVYGQNMSKYDFLSMDGGGHGGGGGGARHKDKADRATVSQVLDERTRVIISKMIAKGLFDQVTGSISMGKEANVFRCEKSRPEGTEYFALKIYKTSILTFQKRSKYVEGDWRWHRGFCKSNPRKMVRTWAEKEIKNLTRIHQAGIPCPTPLLLKGHLLLMSFIGSDTGAAAPRLKNANLSDDKLRELYLQLVIDMRKMYQESHLIHADLSEFNILYHSGKAFIIDVSQSVEHNHPHAIDFLRKDCTNITDFFLSRGVAVMSVKELFDFITDLTISEDNMDSVLEAAMLRATARSYTGFTEEEKIAEEVFKQVYIPRDLGQIRDHEKEFDKQMSGQTAETHYQTVVGLKTDLSGAQEVPRLLEDLHVENQHEGASEDGEDSDNDSEDDNDDADEEGEKSARKDNKRPKNESAEEKRERKQALKEARREKVKSKVKKHVKKRAEKLGSRR